VYRWIKYKVKITGFHGVRLEIRTCPRIQNVLILRPAKIKIGSDNRDMLCVQTTKPMLTFRTENKVLTKLNGSLKMTDTIPGSLSKVSIFKNN